MGRYIATILFLSILGFSGAAFVHFANNPKVVVSQPVVSRVQDLQLKDSKPANTAEPTTTVKTEGPCTTTTNSDVDDTPPDTHNDSTTTIDCSSSSNSSSSSVNITSNSHQSATGGNVSNKNNTNVDVSQ